MSKNWREMLEEIGGYENEFVAVPAGPVREIIDELESALTEHALKDAVVEAAAQYLIDLNERDDGILTSLQALEAAVLAVSGRRDDTDKCPTCRAPVVTEGERHQFDSSRYHMDAVKKLSEISALRGYVDELQQQQDEIIVALGSKGILPSEIVSEIKRLSAEGARKQAQLDSIRDITYGWLSGDRDDDGSIALNAAHFHAIDYADPITVSTRQCDHSSMNRLTESCPKCGLVKF